MKPLISRQSGGTSGDLTVRGHKPKTPTRRSKPPVTTLNVKPSDLGFDPPSPAATRAARAALPTLPQLGSSSTSTPRRPEPRASQPSPASPLVQGLGDLLSPDPNRRSLVAESVLKPLTDLTRTAGREIGKGVELAVELPDQRVDSVLGVPVLGKPKLGEVTRAIAQTARNMPTPAERRAAAAGRRRVAQRQRGPLPARYNQRGELTIPSTRKAVRQLRRAQAQAARSRGGIEGITHPGGAKRFAEALARFTGLNPRFVGAWVQAEGGAFPAGGAAGPQNWLGVGDPVEVAHPGPARQDGLVLGRRGTIIALVCACALSAAAGGGATLLLAEQGPAGPQGERGLEGPPGDSAIDASYEAAEALDRVDDLEGRMSDIESALSSVATVDEVIELEGRIADVDGDTGALCRALDVIC